ncbi:MAG TPA: hypothetical protein VE987_01895 [Polyangiaceae bacterium]|nr:hypothetical protein [Polyangiaceae bacterium]
MSSSDERPHLPAPHHGDGGPGSTPDGIEHIRRLARTAERRIRVGRALRAGVDVLCACAAAAVVVVSLRKLGLVGERSARVALALSALAVVASAVVAWARRLPDRAGARALDRHYDLRDRLASALSFADVAPERRTPFMDAAMVDAATFARTVRPADAVAVGAPRSLGAAAGLLAILSVTMLFEVRKHVALVQARTIDPVEMSADDLEDVKDFVRQMSQTATSDSAKTAVEEFNRLLEDIANKRLDRTEAFRRMEALEEKLLTGSEADKKSLEEQVERIGEELKKSELTRPAGEALADRKLDRAREAMHELAKKMRSTDRPVDKAKLDEMRQALKKAAADAEERQGALERRRQELADEILKLKDKAGDAASDEERSLLEKKERELERLDRDLEGRREAGRQLDRLDRELEQAAEDLMKDLGLSAQDLDQGAEDLNRMVEQDMTQQQKEELRQKLQELRELLRQQAQGGKGQIARLKRFGRMARGQGGSQGAGGQSGDGQQDGQGGSQGQDQQDNGGDGPGGGQGDSKGNGQGGESWVIGPNGEKLLLLSRSQGASGGRGDESGGGKGGREWGEGHDPKVQGSGSNPSPKMSTEDTQVQGSDTGQGGSRSQVILGAAERGFASRAYKRVYTEYHQVAEESLSKDEIPGGYRFYVKRYFQLIRPREGQ